MSLQSPRPGEQWCDAERAFRVKRKPTSMPIFKVVAGSLECYIEGLPIVPTEDGIIITGKTALMGRGLAVTTMLV